MTAPTNTGTAVAKSAPHKEMREQLTRYAPSLASVLPRGATTDRMIALALLAASKNPKLYECTPESVAQSLMRISAWGLEIGTTAHLVPYGRKCEAVADWKGLVQLMIQSRHVRDVKAYAVYDGEDFRVSYGTNAEIIHAPRFGAERGKLTHVYAVAYLRDGRATFDVMGKDEVDAIRAKAAGANSDAWRNHYDEMAKKTVIRRIAKRLPQSPEVRDAIGAEDGEASTLIPAGAITLRHPPVRSIGAYDGDDEGASGQPVPPATDEERAALNAGTAA